MNLSGRDIAFYKIGNGFKFHADCESVVISVIRKKWCHVDDQMNAYNY